MKAYMTALTITLTACSVYATEYHVSTAGLDANEGSASKPLKTISAAARVAQPGDTITVHEGVYRERVNPPRGGESDARRIVYQTARGEKVVIKGSEIVNHWQRQTNGAWLVIIPNSFFGDYNPYQDVISGDWFIRQGRDHHTGEVYLNGVALYEEVSLEKVKQRELSWCCQVDDQETRIWANFGPNDPRTQLVEVNARPTCFYPDQPGRNYITVRGFVMQHAATQWAPPTAEQVALVGTHWSKGWIIEDNLISDSKCVGITLGKHGDEFDNTSANSAGGYVETINRALARGWSKEKIGSHIIRNNTIANCGAAGICGSMGGAFSQITGNHIYNINMDKPFTGHEQAGIKIHAPIDSLIMKNHVHHTSRGIWLDWMTQGTRVTGNLLHDNVKEDLFVEVNHGPFLVDNNVFLSDIGLLESCGGGAYVHNLFAGQIKLRAEKTRETPFHKPHSTSVLGLSKVIGDDERFHNNLFVAHRGLSVYDAGALNLQAVGNVYLAGSTPSTHDRDALVAEDFDPGTKLQEKPDGWWLEMNVDPTWISKRKRTVVTTAALGNAIVSGGPYEKPDGTSYRIDNDYFGKARSTETPAPGPFQFSGEAVVRLNVWPGK